MIEKRPLTDLEKGICVKISKNELEKLKKKNGFLETENYPTAYKEITQEGEIGRFLFFRFFL